MIPGDSAKFDALAIATSFPSSSSSSRSPSREASEEHWYCHCCTAKNRHGESKKCRVCGRPENYAQAGYRLPFHGANAKVSLLPLICTQCMRMMGWYMSRYIGHPTCWQCLMIFMRWTQSNGPPCIAPVLMGILKLSRSCCIIKLP